jgi:hypothetical protein
LLRDGVYGECGLGLAGVIVEFVDDGVDAVFEGAEEDLVGLVSAEIERHRILYLKIRAIFVLLERGWEQVRWCLCSESERLAETLHIHLTSPRYESGLLPNDSFVNVIAHRLKRKFHPVHTSYSPFPFR